MNIHSVLNHFAGRTGGAPAMSGPERRTALMVFALFLSVYLLLVPYTRSNWFLTGDEPHYLALAESIAYDRDLNVANNPPDCVVGAHVHMTENDVWQPSHMIGLPLLLAAPVALSGRLGAAAMMALLSALTVALTYVLAWQVTGRRIAALCSALVLGVSPPFSVYATMLYPEVPGALLVVASLVALNRANRHSWLYAALGLAAGALPWLVIRFAPLSAAIAMLTLVRGLGGDNARRRLLAFAIPCVISACLYLAYNHAIYGSWSPVASYGAVPSTTSVLRPGRWIISVLGWLMDQRVGLLMIAPVYIFGLPGLCHLLRVKRVEALPVVGLLSVGALFGIVLPGFWVQWQPATRYLVVVLPLLALGIGHVVTSVRSMPVRTLTVACTAISVALGFVVYARPWLAYNHSFSVSRLWDALPTIQSLALPDLLPLLSSSKGYKDMRLPAELDSDNLSPTVLYIPGVEGLEATGGSVVRDPSANYGYATRLESNVPADPDALQASTYISAAVGHYKTVVRVRAGVSASARQATEAVIWLSVLSDATGDPGASLARMAIPVSGMDDHYRTFEMDYRIVSPQTLLFRLEYSGATPVFVDHIAVTHTPFALRGVGTLAFWLTVFAFLAAQTFRSLSARGQETASPRFGRIYAVSCIVGAVLLASVYGGPLDPRHWRFDGEAMRRMIGDIRFDPCAGNMLATTSDRAGMLAYGPYVCVPPGAYTAVFRLRSDGTATPGMSVATAQATVSGGTTVLGSVDVASEPLSSRTYRDVALHFRTTEDQQLELRLVTSGKARVWFDQIDLYSINEEQDH